MKNTRRRKKGEKYEEQKKKPEKYEEQKSGENKRSIKSVKMRGARKV